MNTDVYEPPYESVVKQILGTDYHLSRNENPELAARGASAARLMLGEIRYELDHLEAEVAEADLEHASLSKIGHLLRNLVSARTHLSDPYGW